MRRDAVRRKKGELPARETLAVVGAPEPGTPRDTELPDDRFHPRGLTAGEIARAFLISLPAMAQRLVRAQRKVQASSEESVGH